MRKTPMYLLFSLTMSMCLALAATTALACPATMEQTDQQNLMAPYTGSTGVPNDNVVAATANPNADLNANTQANETTNNQNQVLMAAPDIRANSMAPEKFAYSDPLPKPKPEPAASSTSTQAIQANLSGYNANANDGAQATPSEAQRQQRVPKAVPEARLKQPIDNHGAIAN